MHTRRLRVKNIPPPKSSTRQLCLRYAGIKFIPVNLTFLPPPTATVYTIFNVDASSAARIGFGIWLLTPFPSTFKILDKRLIGDQVSYDITNLRSGNHTGLRSETTVLQYHRTTLGKCDSWRAHISHYREPYFLFACRQLYGGQIFLLTLLLKAAIEQQQIRVSGIWASLVLSHSTDWSTSVCFIDLNVVLRQNEYLKDQQHWTYEVEWNLI